VIDWTSWRATDRRVQNYIEKPSTLNTVERCQYMDRQTEKYIAELQAEIAQMQGYRTELFARMQQLYSAAYDLKITLKREVRYGEKKFYFLCLWKVYHDHGIDPLLIESIKFAGTERAQAIKDYRAALKAHPGVACEMDIAKGKWER